MKNTYEPKAQEGICPTCGGLSVCLQSSEHGWFWRCREKYCGVMLPDDNGKPAPVSECPICQCNAVVRYASARKPGLYYQKCEACGGFFGDEDGKVGGAFGPDPAEITQDLRAAQLCDTVADLESVMAKDGLSKQAIRRRIHVLTEEGHIATDPAIPGIGLTVVETASGSYI